MKKSVVIDAVLYRKLRHCAIEYDVTVSHLISTLLSNALNNEMPVEIQKVDDAENSEGKEKELLLQYYISSPILDENCEFLTTTEIKKYLESNSGQKISIRKLGLELRALKYKRLANKRNGQAVYGYEMVKKEQQA